jgi:hypothetical protein
MQQSFNELYLKLLGETARSSWSELEPFFARGVLLQVAPGEDLVGVAEALASDDRLRVAAWLDSSALGRVSADRAEDLLVRDPPLWAVVVAPWVLMQERPAGIGSNGVTG